MTWRNEWRQAPYKNPKWWFGFHYFALSFRLVKIAPVFGPRWKNKNTLTHQTQPQVLLVFNSRTFTRQRWREQSRLRVSPQEAKRLESSWLPRQPGSRLQLLGESRSLIATDPERSLSGPHTQKHNSGVLHKRWSTERYPTRLHRALGFLLALFAR